MFNSRDLNANLLKSTLSDEAILAMLGSGDPSNGVSVVVSLSNLGICFGPELKKRKHRHIISVVSKSASPATLPPKSEYEKSYVPAYHLHRSR